VILPLPLDFLCHWVCVASNAWLSNWFSPDSPAALGFPLSLGLRGVKRMAFQLVFADVFPDPVHCAARLQSGVFPNGFRLQWFTVSVGCVASSQWLSLFSLPYGFPWSLGLRGGRRAAFQIAQPTYGFPVSIGLSTVKAMAFLVFAARCVSTGM
jgi:hypothetical protein